MEAQRSHLAGGHPHEALNKGHQQGGEVQVGVQHRDHVILRWSGVQGVLCGGSGFRGALKVQVMILWRQVR